MVSGETPASLATAAMVVAPYPSPRKRRSAASTIRSWLRRACSRRPLASYERLLLTVITPYPIVAFHSSLLERISERVEPRMQTDGPQGVVDRLERATNAHDVEAVASCFAEDYENETPAHPARGFQGRAQVRRNWEQIFASVPDLHVEIVRSSVDGDHVWTEWDMAGTRLDGSAHRMRG